MPHPRAPFLAPANKSHLQGLWVTDSAHSHFASSPYLDSRTQKERFGLGLFICLCFFFLLSCSLKVTETKVREKDEIVLPAVQI